MLLETLMVKLTGDVSDFVGKMNSAASIITSVGDKMQATGDRMQAIGQKWSLYISAPLIAIGKSALDSAADFEVSMNVIEQVTNATTEQMKAMSDQALRLGRDTVFSANEAAEAQLELSKAGMGVNDVMAAMPGVLDLAAAGNVDLGAAAKLTAGVLNAFGLEAKQSTYVANLLAAAANASAADIGDLALGYGQSSFAFAAAGQKADDLAASLAVLTNVGLKGTDAGTALKNMFTQLYGPTQKAKDVMAAYNIDIFDATGAMKPLVEIVDIFNRQLGGLSQEQRLAALDAILLSDGMKAMIPLMTAGKDGFLAMKDAVNEEGAAADVANARMKGLSGAIEYFKGTIDTLMVETATPWLNTLSEIIRSTANWIAKFSELDPAVQKNIVIMAALVAAVGPVLIYSGLLVSAIGSLVSAFGGLTAFLMANPIVAIAALAAALVALALAWDSNWGGIQEKTRAAADYLKQKFDEIVAYVRDNLPSWVTRLSEWGAAIWQWITDATPIAMTKIGEWSAALIAWIVDKLPDWIATLFSWATALVSWIGESLPTALDALSDWIYEFVGWGKSGKSELISMTTEFASALIDWIANDLIPTVWPEMVKFGNAIHDAIGKIAISIAKAALYIGSAIIQGIVDGIHNGWNALVDAAKAAATGALDAAKSALGIASPSKEGMKIGLNFAEAIGAGARVALAYTIPDLMGDFARMWQHGIAEAQKVGISLSAPWEDPALAIYARSKVKAIGEARTNGINLGYPFVDPALESYRLSQRTDANNAANITVNLSMSFSGNVDRAAVASGAQQGILAGLRQVGLA